MFLLPNHATDDVIGIGVVRALWGAGLAQLVERRLAKAKVAGSRPVSRSRSVFDLPLRVNTSFLPRRALDVTNALLGAQQLLPSRTPLHLNLFHYHVASHLCVDDNDGAYSCTTSPFIERA